METDKQISKISKELKPEKVLMVIITDGQENASREYSLEKVKKLISSHEKKQHWDFVFLGSGLDNFSDADMLGIKYRASSNKANLKSKFGGISNYFVSYFAENGDNDIENMGKLMKDLKD